MAVAGLVKVCGAREGGQKMTYSSAVGGSLFPAQGASEFLGQQLAWEGIPVPLSSDTELSQP